MSSRILRGSRAVPAEPLLFRAVGGRAARLLDARPPAGNAEAQAHIDAAVAQGRQEGQALAEQEATQKAIQQAQQRLEPVLASLNQIVKVLTSQRRQLRAESEEDMVRLAIAIARRILHREITADPEAILGVVKAAFERLNAREIHRLRVSPHDVQIVHEQRSGLLFPPGLEIATDSSLPMGSVVFETTRGELDASVETQLAEIGRGLADVLRRRTA